jgi:hypothetical protein
MLVVTSHPEVCHGEHEEIREGVQGRDEVMGRELPADIRLSSTFGQYSGRWPRRR